jgi:GT2 family glycosyltransferase
LDADDTWLPNFLEEQIESLKSTNADLVYSDALLFGKSPLAGRTFMDLQPSRGDVTPENLLAANVTLLTSAVLARKKPILEVGLFDEAIKRGHDFDLWLRLARLGVRFTCQRKVLAHYRIAESGLSGNAISQLERTLTNLEEIKTRGELTASEEVALDASLNRARAQLAIEKGKDKLLGRDFGGALESFKEAKKFRDGWKLRAVCFALRLAPEMLWRIYHRREMTLRNG